MPEDRRIRRTKRLLGEALIALSLERGYDDITILDITTRADISYATFFRRFTSKEDLMLSLFEKVIEEIAGQISPDTDPRAWMKAVFDNVQANADVYRILLNSRGAYKIQDELEQAIVDVALPLTAETMNQESLVPADVLAFHVSASIFSLARWWLRNDMPYPPEQMAEILHRLVVEPDWVAPSDPA